MQHASLTLLSLVVSANLHAQNQISTDNNDLERMIITGSRIVESIDEVPASIVIITQQQIQDQLKVTSELQSLLSTLVPGLAPSTGTSSNSGQTLRGRAPLIMIDGVPQSTPLRNGSLGVRSLDASTIERIEVIKGATSVYGNGAAGGIINYITKKAASDKPLSGHVTVSSRFSGVKLDDTLGARVDGGINGQLDKFSYVLNASYEENGVQRDAEGDILGLTYGLSDTNTQNYFSKLGYQFDDEKALQVTYNYYKAKQDTDLINVVGNVNSGVKTYAVESQNGASILGEPQGPENHNVMLKYSDDEIFSHTQLVIDAYAQRIENMFFFSTNLANPEQGFDGGQSIIESEKKGLRATFNSQFTWQDIDTTVIYGIDALNDVTSQPLVDGRVWVPEMDMENIAGFVQAKWILHDNIILKAGVRHENIDLKVDDFSTLRLCRTADQCSVAFDVVGDTLNYQATTYNAAIRYNMSDAFSPFISYSQGADISDTGRLLRSATVTDIALIRTEASIIDNYEIGFTSKFDRIRFEFSAYRSTSELGTTNSFDSETGIYLPVRAPQEIYGYEALATYQVQSNLDISATYSWVEGKNTELDVYLGGKDIGAPKGTFNVNWQPADGARLALNYLYVGDRKRFDQIDGAYVGDQGPVDSYHLVNVNGSYDLGNQWQVFMGIENLLNNDYYPTRSQVYTYDGYNHKGLGMTVNIGASYQF
ncbi:TonB-dependent receptor [Paraglaciecola polaris]|uniref:TonB-dependent receptor n=2 Tax=Paraglaciecola polaris TaxID=222814 RepID=UPI0030EF2C7F|tara:strand:- start:11440 stop:13563 length:2124 start_codon:yes stop_codon:yes gene_type:complete